MQIKIDMSFLREWQKNVINSLKRFNILVVHRRGGKTVLAVCILLYKALETQGTYGYISPTYKQSKAIAWDILNKLGTKIPGVKFNISDLICELPNGSKIRLFGADTPDSLRGLDLRGVVFDEYAQQPSSIYGEIIFPMINANNGWCLWIGTPKGKNAFYSLYERGLNDDKFFVKLLSVSQTGLLSAEQLKAAREEMTEEEYNQEYNCSWTAAIKGAVYGKELSLAYEEQRITRGVYNPTLPVFTFWDLGISDAMAILFTQVVGNEIRIIDSYKNTGYGLEHYANYIKSKNYSYDRHYFPHDIEQRELSTGMSRMDTAKKLLGMNCYVVPKNTVESGINAGRLIFKNLRINEQLIDFLNDLSLYQYEFDDKLGIYKKNPKHDFTSHYADAFRYLAVTYNDLIRPKYEEVYEVDYSDFL